jgi:hypothetical protein
MNGLRCLNIGKPLSKLKYSVLTNSVLVPRGKDEIEPLKKLNARNKYLLSKANECL